MQIGVEGCHVEPEVMIDLQSNPLYIFLKLGILPFWVKAFIEPSDIKSQQGQYLK